MHLDALDTPALLVDRARLTRNIERMQATADANAVALRPHVKTHKCTDLARRQQQAGAEGVTVATVAEAETFVAAGFDDVRIAYAVVGRSKYQRVQALREDARVSFCVDTAAGVEAAAAFFAAHDPIDVLIEIDVGHGRCGVPWADAQAIVALARHIERHEGVRLAGLLTHAGQAYAGRQDGESRAEALRRVSNQERDRMLRVATHLLAAEDVRVSPDDLVISIGSTPSMRYFENRHDGEVAITEIRPGNYVFYDAMQVALGAATWEDCALHVWSTVISTRPGASAGHRFYLDAGKKVMTTDTGAGTEGYGRVLDAPAGTVLHRLSEEHAWGQTPPAGSCAVGDRVRIVPNHACVTVATQSALHVVEGEQVVDTWTVAA